VIRALIRHHLSNLRRFTGRDDTGLFWPWAVMLFGAAMIAWMAIFIPEFFGVFARIQRFAAEHPDQATGIRTATSESIRIQGDHPELAPDFLGLVIGMGVIVIAFAGLIAASVTRRLHDRNRRGWWALVPFALLINGLVDMGILMSHLGPGNGDPPFGLFIALFVNNLLYLVTLALLVVQLALSGTIGDNRFGPDPRAEL
jgi:uncharacterized membrane protein YhaH (DUF805 family)